MKVFNSRQKYIYSIAIKIVSCYNKEKSWTGELTVKKAFILALCIFFLFSSKVYAAHDDISLTMYLDGELKPQKAFDISLSVVSEYETGCCRIGFSYDDNALELKNISVKDKSENDTLYYTDTAGTADIIYMPANMHDIVLRLAPKNAAEQYDFEAFLYEACDREGNYLKSDTIFEFSLDTAVNAEMSDHSVTEKVRVKNDVSKSYVQSAEVEVSAEQDYSGEYQVRESVSQTAFLIFAGIAAVFAAGFWAVYKMGFKHGKHTIKNEN